MYEKDELKDMPTLIDKVAYFLYSKMLRRPYNDPWYEDIGIKKDDLTRATRSFIDEHSMIKKTEKTLKTIYDILEFVKLSGKPSFFFIPSFFYKYRTSLVKFQGYNRFTIVINGNPTRFQRNMYEDSGFINHELDKQYMIHDDNYIYPQLLNSDIEDFEKDNSNCLPDNSEIGKYITSEVIDCRDIATIKALMLSRGQVDDLEGDKEYEDSLLELAPGGLYHDASCQYCEINRDLFLPKADARRIMRSIVDFFISDKGRKYYSEIGVTNANVSHNRKYEGMYVTLDLPKGYGKYKIYCKTHYTIRREICLYGDDLKYMFGNKNLNAIMYVHEKDSAIRCKIIDPGFDLIDLKGIICNDIEPRNDMIDLMVQNSSLSSQEKKFWMKINDNIYVDKEDIPKSLKKIVESKWVYDRKSKRSKRMYDLKPELRPVNR